MRIGTTVRRSYQYYRAPSPPRLKPGETAQILPGVTATLLRSAAVAAAVGEPLIHPLLPAIKRDFPVAHFPATYGLQVERGLFVGQRTILTGEHYLDDVSLSFGDIAGDRTHAEAFPYEFRDIPFVAVDGNALIVEDREPAAPLPSGTVFPGSTEMLNFGSWLFRVVPKLSIRSEPRFHALFPQHVARLAVDARIPWQQELLGRGAPDAAATLLESERSYSFENGVLITQPVRNGAFPADLLAALRALVPEALVPGDTPRRIYVSRRKWSEQRRSRVLLNEADVEAALARLGFTPVYPEELGLAKCAQLFAAADIVVGPSGAGMFNALFCRPGAVILEIEQSQRWRSTHANIYRSAGLNFGFIDNSTERQISVVHENYRVDLLRLQAVISDVLPSS